MGKSKVVLGAMKVYPIVNLDVVANGAPTTAVHNLQLHPQHHHRPSRMKKLVMPRRHDTGTARAGPVDVLTSPLVVQTTM